MKFAYLFCNSKLSAKIGKFGFKTLINEFNFKAHNKKRPYFYILLRLKPFRFANHLCLFKQNDKFI